MSVHVRIPTLSGRPRQRGISLIIAIFLLLLLAALAAFIANFRAVSETTSTEDVLGTRAYFAARTGAERVMFQVMDPNNLPAGPPPAAPGVDGLPACVTPFTLPALPDFPGFNVTVTCVAQAFNEGTRRLRIYQIESTATVQGPAGLIERQVAVTVENCRDTLGVAPLFECF